MKCPDSLGTCNPEGTGLPWLLMSLSPPYSMDLAPSDGHMFSILKKQLKVRNFSSDMEVTAAEETWLNGQPSEFLFEWIAKVRARG
jgi:hypothetical protein